MTLWRNKEGLGRGEESEAGVKEERKHLDVQKSQAVEEGTIMRRVAMVGRRHEWG